MYEVCFVHIPFTGAAPEPCVTRLHQTKDQALLQCEVRGAFPEPRVEWLDSSGITVPSQKPHVSETGGHFYIILQTTVNKTDRFRCVATQEELSHQISTVTYVHLYGRCFLNVNMLLDIMSLQIKKVLQE